MKTTNNSTFQADITKALVKEMSRLGLDPKTAAYVCGTYDFNSYLLEGSLSGINQQIFHVQTSVGLN